MVQSSYLQRVQSFYLQSDATASVAKRSMMPTAVVAVVCRGSNLRSGVTPSVRMLRTHAVVSEAAHLPYGENALQLVLAMNACTTLITCSYTAHKVGVDMEYSVVLVA